MKYPLNFYKKPSSFKKFKGNTLLSKRNKRKNKRSRKASSSRLSSEQLESQIRQALSNAHYKLAIQSLKALIKKVEKSDSILKLLQQAYTGRAEELAETGMLKEAVAIWDVGTQYGLNPVDQRYLGWIVDSKQYSRIAKIYEQISLEDKHNLQPKLAANCLSGDLSILKLLPADDPLHSSYEVANRLLQAWCSDADEEQLAPLMKAISFRSPYRELRQIVQASLLFEKSPEQAEIALQRIARTSPFYPLAEQLYLAQLDTPAFLMKFSSLPTKNKKYALEVRQWSDKQTLNILKKLEALKGNPNKKTLSNTLLLLSKQLKNTQLSPAIKNWLDNKTKKVWAISEGDHFANLNFKKLSNVVGELTTLEKNYYQCLATLSNPKSLRDLANKIEKYQEALKTSSDQKIEKSDRRLISALMSRYLLEQWKEYNNNKLTKISLRVLEKLLTDDPSDYKSWLELLEYHLQKKNIKAARDALNQAIKHHPHNIQILDLAVRIAIASNAFVKAANYAKRIIDIDPINRNAQQYLQQAHLSHARKQIKQKKWHLAEKELLKTKKWKGTALTKLLIEVLKAYLLQAEKGVKTAAKNFQELAKKTGANEVELDFIIRHQGIQTKQSYKTSLRNAKLTNLWNKPNKEKLWALMNIVQQLREINADGIKPVLKTLFTPLKKATKLPFSEQEGEQLCEFWVQNKEEGLLHEYSHQLRRQYGDKPIFIYYSFVNFEGFSPVVFDLLEQAWSEAKQQKDEALTARLAGLLEKLSRPYSDPFGDIFFDDIDAIEEEIEEISMLDCDDEEKGINIIINLLPRLPIKEVFSFATQLMGKKTAQLILDKYGEKQLRNACIRGLKGDNPQDIMNDLAMNTIGLL